MRTRVHHLAVALSTPVWTGWSDSKASKW